MLGRHYQAEEKTSLKQLTKNGKIMTMYSCLHPRADVDHCISIKEDEKGLIKVKDAMYMEEHT